MKDCCAPSRTLEASRQRRSNSKTGPCQIIFVLGVVSVRESDPLGAQAHLQAGFKREYT